MTTKRNGPHPRAVSPIIIGQYEFHNLPSTRPYLGITLVVDAAKRPLPVRLGSLFQAYYMKSVNLNHRPVSLLVALVSVKVPHALGNDHLSFNVIPCSRSSRVTMLTVWPWRTLSSDVGVLIGTRPEQ